ncbi:MAG: hypothetical protein PUH91_06260 [Prevotella sp.]|nr:hypothetical protein [Prevotella sp.]
MASYNNTKSNVSGFQKISMALLACLPLLAWYAIPFPVSLGYALVLFLSAYSIVRARFRINVLPLAFWCVFAYIAIVWAYRSGFQLWSLFPPGGWLFFIFFLALVWGVINFDLDQLIKYMRLVVWVSAALFWIQFILKLSTGSAMFCFVPNLTGAFTYEGMSYAELAAHQLSGSRPCSIFMEPSYMAHYYVSYLALVWFAKDAKTKVLSKEIVFIIITLIALKSGSGMVALAALFAVKLFSLYWNSGNARRVALVLFSIPLIVAVVYFYVGSESGQDMISRSAEFSTEGTSGYTRVVAGFVMFDQLDFNEQFFGIQDAKERFGLERWDGSVAYFANGFQTILLSLGYVGALLYLLFYILLFRKVNLYSKMCLIILLLMSLLESNYLNPFMMLLTIIPCADYYINWKQRKAS